MSGNRTTRIVLGTIYRVLFDLYIVFNVGFPLCMYRT